MTALYFRLLVCVGCGLLQSAVASEISPEEAYKLIQQSGRIENVTITGNLDLARLRHPKNRAIEVSGVILRGKLIQRGHTPPVPIHFLGGENEGIKLSDGHLRAEFVLDNVLVRGVAQFNGTVFGGPVHIYNKTKFLSAVSFLGAQFDGPVEILNAEFAKPPGPPALQVSFKDAVFKDRARFANVTSERDVWFDSAVFHSDVSFLQMQVSTTAYFRNTQFMRDADFRFCKFGTANFGDSTQMTTFHGLADFRGCTMQSAKFEYTEFLGNVAFVNTSIIPGDLSLENAALRGASTDLSGLRVDGKILLDKTHFSNLQFRWRDIGSAILRAKPDSNTLTQLRRHLDAAGESAEAKEVAYYLADRQMYEQLHSDNVEWSEWLWIRSEWLVWGWPTGYGTKLGRIIVIALAVWLFFSVPLLVLSARRKLTFARFKPTVNSDGTSKPVTPRYEAVSPESVVDGSTRVGHVASVGAVLTYTMSLMFKLPVTDLHPVAPVSSAVAHYLRVTYWLGSLLIALIALTLANVSPAIQAVIGKVLL